MNQRGRAHMAYRDPHVDLRHLRPWARARLQADVRAT